MAFQALIALAALANVQPPEAVERWRQDVAVARSDFLSKDLSYTDETRAQARQRLDQLTKQLPALTDQQIVAELARVAALAGNGHTRAYLLRNRGWWRRYPIRIWKFSDGWHVVAVRPGNEEMLGARIVTIAGKAVQAAEDAVAPLYAGPPTWRSYMASYSLTSPDALLGTGVLGGGGSVALGLEKDKRRFAATLAPVDEPKRQVPEESWWFLSPAHPATEKWTHVLAGRALPTSLKRPSAWYDFRMCGGNIYYLSFNRAEDQPGQATLASFGQRVLEQIAAAPQARLVIDLRYNTGGNLQKTQGFFQNLAKSQVGQTRGRLFVIVGPSTFSAGITPVAILKQDGKPVLVGTSPGDHSEFWAEGGNVVLPNSGINLHYADRAHVYAPGRRSIAESLVYLRLNGGSLKPDRPAALSFRDYVRGIDPAAEKIEPKGLQCAESAK